MLRILRVLAPNPGVYTLEGTNTWIVGESPAVVIDPGPDDSEHLREVMREAGPVDAILVTHGHPDHAPGAPALSAMTGAPVFASRPTGGGERLRDGQVIRAGDVAVTAVPAPGHSPDHVVFLVEAQGALFTGDAVLGRGTSVIDPPEGDLAAYLRSLKRMRDLRPRTIHPGHGPLVLDAVAKLDEYIEHRAIREEQVIATLKAGARTPEEMVAEIYADYPPDVHPLAARSVVAHLIKLEVEGRVARTGKASAPVYELSEPRMCARCGRRQVRRKARLCGPCSLAILQE